MEHATLSSLIDALERGTKMHICVAFLDHYGNSRTRCSNKQTIHDRPVCLAIKKQPNGLEACFRCRMSVQRAVIRYRRSMAGYCTNGVYEYCRPIIYENRVICVVFVGNILTGDPLQRQRLCSKVDESLLQTMEPAFSYDDCVRTADILESYILFLFAHYGVENKTFDPLVENIKNYLRENISYDFTMEELAAAFHYSPKYLGRVFKHRTGQTVKEYCNRAKIAQAKLLMTETDLRVEEIALQVGFNNITYFDRVFRQITGLSPKSYRASERNTEGKT